MLRYLAWGLGGGLLWVLIAMARSPDAFLFWHGPAAGVGFAVVLWGTEDYRRANVKIDRTAWAVAGVVASLVVLAGRFAAGSVTNGEIAWRILTGAGFGLWSRTIAQRQSEEKRTRQTGVVPARSTDDILADVKWAMKGLLIPAAVLTVLYSAIAVLGDFPSTVLWLMLAVLWGALLLGAPIVGLLRPRLIGPMGYALVFSVAALPVGGLVALMVTSSFAMGVAATLGMGAGGAIAGVMLYARGDLSAR